MLRFFADQGSLRYGADKPVDESHDFPRGDHGRAIHSAPGLAEDVDIDG